MIAVLMMLVKFFIISSIELLSRTPSSCRCVFKCTKLYDPSCFNNFFLSKYFADALLVASFLSIYINLCYNRWIKLCLISLLYKTYHYSLIPNFTQRRLSSFLSASLAPIVELHWFTHIIIILFWISIIGADGLRWRLSRISTSPLLYLPLLQLELPTQNLANKSLHLYISY